MEPTLNAPQHDPYLWKQAKARVGFRLHFRSYLIVNGGLWLIWALSSFAFHSAGHTGSIFPWPFFAMLGWGIGLVSHYFSVYRRSNHRSMIDEEYQKLTNHHR